MTIVRKPESYGLVFKFRELIRGGFTEYNTWKYYIVGSKRNWIVSFHVWHFRYTVTCRLESSKLHYSCQAILQALRATLVKL